jgi:phage major head subunit gpT-like protein
VAYEDIRFDRVGKIQQLARVMGRAAAITEENNVYEQVTTTANYTSTAANRRNDVGANFIAATTLTAATFETALATIATAKDPNGSSYLNCRADTIIIGPRSEQQVKKFLMSDLMQGAGGTDATERGNMNPYKGLIKKVIVSPYFSDSYDWALADTSQMGIWGLQFQEVDAPQVIVSDQSASNTDWIVNRQVRYGVYMLHGVGFIDSRAWYYSTSSTAPAL